MKTAKQSSGQPILSAAFAILTGAALLSPCGARSLGAGAYEAEGYLVYTGFNDSGQPNNKVVQMFNVKVNANGWHIRMEPVLQRPRGMGYYEASGGTNDTVLFLTVFAAKYNPSESPFRSFRAKLEKTEKEAVYFNRNHPENDMSAAFELFAQKTPGYAAKNGADTKRLDNVAIAQTFNGAYPPMKSEIALIWFALTPPRFEADGTNKMLLQTWNDGNPTANRFRRARWSQFPEPPALASGAVYHWPGKEFRPDGTESSIGAASGPDIAARYVVAASTNCGGLELPLKFQLTRFNIVKPGSVQTNHPRVLETVVASVVRVRVAAAEEPLQVEFPGKTFVSDYRASSGELEGSPLSYVLGSSNSLPTVQEAQERSRHPPFPRGK